MKSFLDDRNTMIDEMTEGEAKSWLKQSLDILDYYGDETNWAGENIDERGNPYYTNGNMDDGERAWEFVRRFQLD